MLLSTTTVITTVISLICGVRAGVHWGYEGSDGPQSWGGECNKGSRQSPIDVSGAKSDPSMELKFVNYGGDVKAKISNNDGHSLVVEPMSKGQKLEVDGVKYNLLSVHFHWGPDDHHGSEHKINGKSFPLEAHFVHLREGLSGASGATKEGDLAVVGVMYSVGAANSEMEKITKHVQLKPGESKTMEDTVQLMNLLPQNKNKFYRYSGSLTTPGCSEVVSWNVMGDPLTVSHDQLQKLGQVVDDQGKKLDHNNRPTQPLNGREILKKA